MCVKDRRVTELLADHIPEDEAKLLSNGRYTCLVCNDRPVVDTLAMLSQHRVGKKHRFSLAKFMKRKEETEMLILKRKQETYLKSGATDSGAPLHPDRVLGQATTRGLLKTSSTYDSRSRSKYKPYSRKEVIEYDRQEKVNQQQVDSLTKPVNPKTQVNKYIRQSQRKRDFTEVVEIERRLAVTPKSSASFYTPKLDTPKPPERVNPESSARVAEAKTVDERSKYYQNLRASGWKRDLLGNWVRDDDAEFDSDEEPPEEYDAKVM
ncbi:sodium channel modifier 1-like isoform X2 [Penaeus japonicus]|uniref:sodium channel modifier 1-like isoform X2 n=1 Tax=Penaeus japonicus TaxID=27405 RepID=UPI001C71202A|nr:sodium channel modifier 1-like isoform X2 [Penaeus japonicus]